MAGICSKHQLYATECRHCKTAMRAFMKEPLYSTEVVKNHIEWFAKLTKMVVTQAEAVHKRHNDMDSFALLQNIRHLENQFTVRYD